MRNFQREEKFLNSGKFGKYKGGYNRKGIRGIGILQDNFQYFFIDFYGSFMYDSIAKYGMPKCGDPSIAAVIPKQYYERGYTYYGKS